MRTGRMELGVVLLLGVGLGFGVASYRAIAPGGIAVAQEQPTK